MKLIYYSIFIFLISCSPKNSIEWEGLIANYFEYEKNGQYENAKIEAEKALKVALKDFGKSDIRTAKTYNNIAEMFRELGQVDEAVPLYENAIKIAKVNKNFLNLIAFYTNLGILYNDNRQSEIAKPYFEESLRLGTSLKLDNNERMITPLTSLGYIAISNKNLVSAHTYFYKSLEIAHLNYQLNDINYARIYESLAILKLNEGKLDSMFFFLTKSKTLKEQFYEKNHPVFAVLYGQFGAYYHIAGSLDSAKYYYEKSIQIRPKKGKFSNIKSFQTMKNLSRLYFDLGDSLKAQELLVEVERLGDQYN